MTFKLSLVFVLAIIAILLYLVLQALNYSNRVEETALQIVNAEVSAMQTANSPKIETVFSRHFEGKSTDYPQKGR